MAVWFFVIFAAFILIWLITGNPNTVKPSLLTLMGISAATALGSAAVESKRRRDAGAQLTAARLEHGQLQARLGTLAAEIQDIDTQLARPGLAPADAAPLIKLRTDKQIEQGATQTKADQGVAVVANLEGMLAPQRSESFITDIMSDESGISLHRFQIVAWTTILVVVFWKSVWESLAMPDFDANLLTLMGISSGTYIGFKFAEKN
jgi:hypothetical protein